MSNQAITFKSETEEELVLKKVHYNVNIDGLISNIAIEQHFINPFDKNLEAIYTFPLTPNAVLMDVKVHINDRKLQGTIINSKEADTKYEEALEDGNRAIMVEKDYDGLYTVNVGNLLANDAITIILEYSELLEWNHDRIKMSIPTVIAQKYGNPSDLSLDDTSTPENKFLTENSFTFDMSVIGILQNAKFTTPSHDTDVKELQNSTKLKLNDISDFMDRDITIIIESKIQREKKSFALVGNDYDGYAAIASFYPSIANKDYTKEAKNVTFVVDCSGSMSGVSIDKARIALSKAISKLDSMDTMNLILFGSYTESIFNSPVFATTANKDIINRAIDNMDADMGGTEMAEALNTAYQQQIDIKAASYLFLITDGEIYDHEEVIANAIRSEMKHFIVGVGYATDAVLLTNISIKTSGAFENVDPNEQMDDAIINLFKKIDMPKTESLHVNWSCETKYCHEPKYLFDGDTMFVMAKFNQKPQGNVTLNYTLENGDSFSVTTQCTEVEETEDIPSSIARIVANAKMLKMTESEEIKNISETYQLFSSETKYLLIDEVTENEKPIYIPESYKVNHMMPQSYSAPGVFVRPKLVIDSQDSSDNYLDIPQYMRQSNDSIESSIKSNISKSANDIVNKLPDYYIQQQANSLKITFSSNSVNYYPNTINDLIDLGIDRDEIIEWVKMQDNEEQAVYDLIRELLSAHIDNNKNNKIDIITSKHYKIDLIAS